MAWFSYKRLKMVGFEIRRHKSLMILYYVLDFFNRQAGNMSQ